MKNLSHTLILCAVVSTASNAYGHLNITAGALVALNVGTTPLAMWYCASAKSKLQQEEQPSEQMIQVIPSQDSSAIIGGPTNIDIDLTESENKDRDEASETTVIISTTEAPVDASVTTTNNPEALLDLYPWMIQP